MTRSITISEHGAIEDARLPNSHILLLGASGQGKSRALSKISRAYLRDATMGFLCVDPDGALATDCVEFCANPVNRLPWRTVHHLRPASSTHSFSLGLLDVRGKRTPQACHDVAVRAKSIFQSILGFGADEYGPRLSKLFQLGTFGLALTGRPLVVLPDLFSLGASRLRDEIAAAYPYEFMSDELRALDVLGEKNPRQFLEYRDALISRLMPVLSNNRMRRIFGSADGLDFRHILPDREAVFLDLSGIEQADAVLIGNGFSTILFHEVLQRPPNASAEACLMIDEVMDYLSAEIMRGYDRFRKYGIRMCVAAQRLTGQLVREGDRSAVSALITNSAIKVFFGGLEPVDAEYAARVLFTGFVPTSEWKPDTERPVAVGHDKTLLKNRSDAEHDAEHEATSYTQSRSHGHAHGVMNATTSGNASGTGATEHTGQMLSSDGGLLSLPNVVGQSAGAGVSQMQSASSSMSSGISDVDIESEGEATTTGRGTSHGRSHTTGEAETLATRYEWMPSSLFSIPDQLHRLEGELINLAPREVFLKLGNRAPIRTRIVEVPPAFTSQQLRSLMLPGYLARAAEESPYIIPVDEADRQLAAYADAALQRAATVPDPDLSIRERFPALDELKETIAKALDPEPPPPPKPKRPPKGSKPKLVVTNENIPVRRKPNSDKPL